MRVHAGVEARGYCWVPFSVTFSVNLELINRLE